MARPRATHCGTCAVPLTLDNAYRRSDDTGGTRSTCKACWAKQRRGRHDRREDARRAALGLTDVACEVCGALETVTRAGAVRRPTTDHDHVTGVYRGVLCSRCNSAIGLMGDEPERLRAAAEYLERHAATSHASGVIPSRV